MEKLNRRSFFGVALGGFFGGKRVIQQAIVPLAVPGALMGADDYPIGLGSGSNAPEAQPARELGYAAARALAETSGGLPDWLKQQWADEAKHIRVLDPDIAAMGSWSLAAKIDAQRDRVLAKAEEEFWERGRRHATAETWRKAFGYFGWW